MKTNEVMDSLKESARAMIGKKAAATTPQHMLFCWFPFIIIANLVFVWIPYFSVYALWGWPASKINWLVGVPTFAFTLAIIAFGILVLESYLEGRKRRKS